MAIAAESTLVERDQQLTALADALSMVSGTSRGGLALVAGEAGAGKTELLRRFCEGAGRNVRTLWASCDALATPRPLGPLFDLAALMGGELEEQVAAKAPPHDVAATLLRELAAPAPAVVVLEDVHWADAATVDVLRLVSRRVDTVPALLIVSFRKEQVGRNHPWQLLLGELPRNRSVTRVEVAPLSRDGVAALAERADVDVDELYSRTGGNPFFVTETLAAQTQAIPETVRDAVLARAARLSGGARALLDAVAVVPGHTEIWLLEALDEIAPGAVEEAVESGMLRAEGDGVSFRHELARLAIEESLPPDHRVALHRRAVAALTAHPGGAQPARLAHHAEAAGDAAAVLRFAVAAGEQAASLGAHREAANQYARALRFAGSLSSLERAELLERFAAEGYFTDMRAESIEAAAEAASIHREGGDTLRAGDVMLLQSRTLYSAGRIPEARACVDEAIALWRAVGSDDALARALAEEAYWALLEDRLEAAISAGTRAVELAERAGPRLSLIRALNALGTSELILGIDAGLEKIMRGRDLSREAGLLQAAGTTYVNAAEAFGRRRRWKRAEPGVVEGVEFCRKHGLEAWENCMLGQRAEMELALGRLDEAAATASEVLERTQGSHATAQAGPLVVLALVRARRGDPERWPLLDEARELAREGGNLLQYSRPVAAGRAEAAWLEGRPEAIEAETAEAFALAVQHREGIDFAQLAVWRKRAGIVDELPDGLADGPYAPELAGDHEGAAAGWQELGMPYEAALALAGADDEEALRSAHEQLQALGARPAAAIVARRLRARGARNVPKGPRARTRESPAGLTSRELEVLGLLVEGLSNADIAQRLVLSERTVHHHVSAVLRKLGVGSRGQATAAALRMGILEAAER